MLLTNVEITVWGECRKAANDEKEVQKVAVTAPSIFKKDTKWQTWKEQFTSFLGSKYGQCKAPLNFVIHEADEPADPDDFTDEYD